jgi:hypothetical protein
MGDKDPAPIEALLYPFSRSLVTMGDDVGTESIGMFR